MKRIALIAALMLGIAGTANICAQTEKEQPLPKPDLTGETLDSEIDVEALHKQADTTIGKDGEAQWFVTMDYNGFEFEVPAGMLVEKGTSLTARYPDGSFGISMTSQDLRGANQKTAYEVCRKLAAELRLPIANVEKVSFGKCGGARTSGMIEGQQVTVLVLPYNARQITTVMLCTPDRLDWANHFQSTLKR